MKLQELTGAIAQLYNQQTELGIFFGMITGRDVCVSTAGPFEVELVGEREQPTFHGVHKYVRYHVARRVYSDTGMQLEP